ncbi:MAG: carbohydrate binding family 9 domain-containing protein, partial [Gemmatimonadetes bacterium]|nr:carbohydrate binding family 9 domain-containing protein [Gemmatimonadota bacterium]
MLDIRIYPQKLTTVLRSFAVLLLFRTSLLLLGFPQVLSLSAQEVTAARSTEPIQVDGVLDEAAWADAGSITGFTQLQPSVGEAASQRTVVRVLYDDRMMYFGIESRDENPEEISRTITRRDGEVWEDDAVALILDTFNDDNNAYVFMVNSLGTQQDERWADNGRTRDVKWDGTWESAGSIRADGWVAEVAIPFESLRFDRRTDRWGLNVIRYIPRHLEQSHWVAGLSEWFRIAEIGSITGLDLTEAITKSYTLIPYVQYAFTNDVQPKGEVGLDVRYSLSSNLGLDLTFNPDFATVEADVEQVNLTRYELSYPEKRPFFLEGAENYSTRIRQFYSRRVGEIPWGGKINGKLGSWRINALATLSDSSATAPSSSGKDAFNSVFRVSRELP